MGLPNKIIKRLGINVPEKYQWIGSAILGVLMFLALTLLAMTLMTLLSKDAKAEQNGWFTSAETFLIIEQAQNDRTSFCRESRHDLTSNLGADLTVYKREWFEVHTRASHHSCAFGPDSPDYNAVGAGVVFHFDRK